MLISHPHAMNMRWFSLLLLLAAGCNHAPVPSAVAPLPVTRANTTPADEQWSGWRGAEKGGVEEGSPPPEQWNQPLWRTSLSGLGNSSPVIWGDQLYLTSTQSHDSQQQLTIHCFQVSSGEELWSHVAGLAAGDTHAKNGFASATCATDGERIVACFGAAGLVCCDRQGNRLWQVPLPGYVQQWGAASSPVIARDLVIQLCDGQDSARLAAFDLSTGALVWESPRQSHGCWSTPILVETAQTTEIVVNGTGSSEGEPGSIIAYDLRGGRELWRMKGTSDIPCPTLLEDNGLYISASGGNGPILAFRRGGAQTDLLWSTTTGGAYVPTGILYRDRYYNLSDGGVVSCHIPETGELIWSKRLRGIFSASLIAGGGRIYALSERGDLYIFSAEDRYELVAAHRLNQPCLATPAIAQGKLFVRSESELLCFGEQTVVSNPLPPHTAVPSPSDAPE